MTDHDPRPLIFSSRMVQAIMRKQNPKTQTRRVVSQRHLNRMELDTLKWGRADYSICPYGQTGDLLWVRETYNPGLKPERSRADGYRGCVYRADDLSARYSGGWTPSIFMPRRHSRLTLEIVSVRVELLQHITATDICAEMGLPLTWPGPGFEPYPRNLRQEFANLWDEINKRGYLWRDNPHVWVVEFKLLRNLFDYLKGDCHD